MADLKTDELITYVRKYRKQEFTFEEIRSSLLKQECKDEDVKKAIEAIKKEEGSSTQSASTSTIIALCLGYAVSLALMLYFLARSGVSGTLLYTPFSTIFGLLDGSIRIQWVSLGISALFSSVALACYIALQFHKVALRILYLLPLTLPFGGLIAFGFSRFGMVAVIALCAAHYYILLDVEHRKDAYKKIIAHEIAFQSLNRCLLPALLIIASFIAIVTWEDGSYAQNEVGRVFMSAGFDTGSVESLHGQLKERQLKNTYDVLTVVGNSFVSVSRSRLSQTCQAQFDEAFQEVDRGIKQQLQENVEQGGVMDPAQVEKLESLTKMVQRMRTSYPLLSAVFGFMVLEMFKRLLCALASALVWIMVPKHA